MTPPPPKKSHQILHFIDEELKHKERPLQSHSCRQRRPKTSQCSSLPPQLPAAIHPLFWLEAQTSQILDINVPHPATSGYIEDPFLKSVRISGHCDCFQLRLALGLPAPQQAPAHTSTHFLAVGPHKHCSERKKEPPRCSKQHPGYLVLKLLPKIETAGSTLVDKTPGNGRFQNLPRALTSCWLSPGFSLLACRNPIRIPHGSNFNCHCSFLCSFVDFLKSYIQGTLSSLEKPWDAPTLSSIYFLKCK